MHSAKNCLSGICESSKKSDNVKSSQGVKTGGRFVQEEKQFWLAGQFHCNGESLALLLIQARACRADGCTCN